MCNIIHSSSPLTHLFVQFIRDFLFGDFHLCLLRQRLLSCCVFRQSLLKCRTFFDHVKVLFPVTSTHSTPSKQTMLFTSPSKNTFTSVIMCLTYCVLLCERKSVTNIGCLEIKYCTHEWSKYPFRTSHLFYSEHPFIAVPNIPIFSFRTPDSFFYEHPLKLSSTLHRNVCVAAVPNTR